METILCEKHGLNHLKLVTQTSTKYFCTTCLYDDHEILSLYIENLDLIQEVYSSDFSKYLDKLKDYEGFANINKVFKEELEKTPNIGDKVTSEYLSKNAYKIFYNLEKALKSEYTNTCQKFEKTVEELIEKTDKLDLSLKSAKDELNGIQKSLDDQTEMLSSDKMILEIFSKITNKLDSRINHINIEKFVDEETKFNFSKGNGDINFQSGSNISVSMTGRGGSYNREMSEQVFSGPLLARIKINNITRKNDWNLNIGLIRANNTNSNNYYQDGVFYMCSGKITVQYQGNQGRNITRAWENGDEIIIKRDENNDIWFGLNEDSSLQKVYTNITGEMRLCVGYSSSSSGDNIEILEVDL